MDLDHQLSVAPVTRVPLAVGQLEFRQAGAADSITHVLLHGIGSSADSWVYQLGAAAGGPAHRVLAWNAPGYGNSSPLESESPSAQDYGRRLWLGLDQLGADQPLVLVGHSLGALMAAAAAACQPARVSHLVLLAPARGYGKADAGVRESKLSARLGALQTHGPQGLAERRAPYMVSSHASPDWVAWVRRIMAGIQPGGYAQASRLLANSDLLDELRHVACGLSVASGEADVITPPAGCRAVAEALDIPWNSLGPVGHACSLEAANEVNALLGLPALHHTDSRHHEPKHR